MPDDKTTTSPTTDIQPELLPVIQADREAMLQYEARRPVPLAPLFAERVRNGRFDRDDRVQAFARHRLTSTTPTLGDMVMREADMDWLATAKAAGKFGIRYATNARLVDFLNEALSAAPASPIPTSVANEGERERIARIIAPNEWRRYDATLLPFIENRGAHEGESWHVRAYMAGCRTADDARRWWLETATNEPVDVYLLRASLTTADTILSALSPALDNTAVEGRYRAALEQIARGKLRSLPDGSTEVVDDPAIDPMQIAIEALRSEVRS